MRMKLNTVLLLAAIAIFLLNFGICITTYVSIQGVETIRKSLTEENEHERLSAESRYHIVQVQQFLTDASLTKEQGSISEAIENAKLFEANLDRMVEIRPADHDDIEKIRALERKVTEVGLEMTTAYWRNGKEAGDAIMKRPKTGLDDRSKELADALDRIGTKAKSAQAESEQVLANRLANFKGSNLIISGASSAVSILAFWFLFLKLRPLLGIATRLQLNSNELKMTVGKLNITVTDLSSASAHQSSATQQTAASLEEIRAMVDRTSENSERMRATSQKSQTFVSDGKQALDRVVRKLNKIDSETRELVENVQSGNREVSGIVTIISEIGAKTKVINDIVFQTKLLSFNASVEAARAGEHGKGFSVVAEEVGNLARMSGEAAKEISQMLELGIEKVETIIKQSNGKVEKSIELNRNTIAEGVESAEKCQENFDQIVGQVDEVGRASEEIRLAIEEQSKGLTEIGLAIETLESATTQNVTTSESVTKSGHGISDSVGQLEVSIAEISAMISGQKAQAQVLSLDGQDGESSARELREAS